MLTKTIPEKELDALRERVVELENQLARQEQTVSALRENEARLQSVLNNLLDAPYRRNLRTDRYDYLSPVIEQITGWTVEEMSQADIETVLDQVHPDDLPQVQREIERIDALCREAGRAMGTLEYRFRTKAGDYRWLGDYLTMVAGEDGLPLYRVGVVRDITERKRVEGELHIALEKYRVLFETFPLGISITDEKGNLMEVNRESERLLGLARQNHLQRTYDGPEWRIIRPDGTLMPSDEYASVRALKEKRLVENVEMGIVKDGDEITWLSVTAAPIPLDGYGVAIAYGDITEHKRAEAVLQRQARMNDAYFTQSINCFVLFDRNFNFIQVNETFARNFGKTVEDFIGLTYPDVFPSDERFHDRTHPLFDEIIRTKQPLRFFARPFTFIGQPERGETYWDWTMQPILDEKGEVEFIFFSSIDVTERKRAEVALQESEERFRLFMDNSPTIAWIQDNQSRYVYLNQTYEKRFGVQLEAWRGKTIFEVWSPEQAQQLWQNDQKVLTADHLLEFTEELPNPDGSLSTWWSFKFPFQDASGQRYAAGIALDITEQQQMEFALRQSEERFAKAFQASPYALIISRLDDGRIIEVNERWQEVSGYSRDESIGHSSLALNIYVNPAERQKAVAQAQKEGAVRDFEVEIRRKTGEVRQVSLSIEMIELNNEPCLLTTAHDITERRKIEEALYLTRFSVEHAPHAIHWVNEEGRLIDVNETACQMGGYSREEMLQLSIFDLDPELTQAQWVERWQLLRQRRTITIEATGLTREGRRFPLEVAANYLEFGGQALNCIFARDISERKAAEAERAKLEEQLRQSQKMESVGRLAGGVAHDFNNHLTVILGYSELMQARLPLEDRAREQLEQIRQSAKRAESLTRQLLAFSRKQMLVPVVFDLNELITNLRKMLERLIGEDITLITVLHPDLWSIKADPGQIEQVIMNLAANARDAMPTGGRLTIATANISFDDSFIQIHPKPLSGRGVKLTVTDTGSGMDQETQTHIFEPFFTTKEKGKGTGLGLSTVYGIVKQSGGEITVNSQPNQGTAFTLYLPAHEAVSVGLAAPQPEPVVNQGEETILLVEDEEGVRELVRAALRDYGYTLLEADHGYQALALAKQQPKLIDLLLTDVVMPDINGRELAERIKALYPEIKVLFMSGYTDNEVIRHGVQRAEVEFMAKPFSPIALAAKIRTILDK